MGPSSTPSPAARDAGGSSDDEDAARFVEYVRDHVHHAAAMNRRARGDDDDASDDDDPMTPSVSSRVDRVLASARASAREASASREARDARGRWEISEARASASARRLAASAMRRRPIEGEETMVNEMDEEKVRTPVRVGTLRSTHMSKGGEARALRFDAAATEGKERLGKASMTPPRALRMTVMSPGRRSEAAVRLSESVRESSSSWAVATTTSRADEDARRDAEAERERLRARVVTMERDAEAAADAWRAAVEALDEPDDDDALVAEVLRVADANTIDGAVDVEQLTNYGELGKHLDRELGPGTVAVDYVERCALTWRAKRDEPSGPWWRASTDFTEPVKVSPSEEEEQEVFVEDDEDDGSDSKRGD